MSEQEHTHAWTEVAHMDGCHWYRSAYSCQCGATMLASFERDVNQDVYARAWMDPHDEPCQRCLDLIEGAEPRRHSIVVDAEGRVEHEEDAVIQ